MEEAGELDCLGLCLGQRGAEQQHEGTCNHVSCLMHIARGTWTKKHTRDPEVVRDTFVEHFCIQIFVKTEPKHSGLEWASVTTVNRLSITTRTHAA